MARRIFRVVCPSHPVLAVATPRATRGPAVRTLSAHLRPVLVPGIQTSLGTGSKRRAESSLTQPVSPTAHGRSRPWIHLEMLDATHCADRGTSIRTYPCSRTLASRKRQRLNSNSTSTTHLTTSTSRIRMGALTAAEDREAAQSL